MTRYRCPQVFPVYPNYYEDGTECDEYLDFKWKFVNYHAPEDSIGLMADRSACILYVLCTWPSALMCMQRFPSVLQRPMNNDLSMSR